MFENNEIEKLTQTSNKLTSLLEAENGVAVRQRILEEISEENLHCLLRTEGEKFQFIRITRTGQNRGSILPGRRFIKDAYIRKTFIALCDNKHRKGIVKFFMQIFKKEGQYNQYDIRTIHHWLKRFRLSRAEIQAIIFHIGYKYRSKSSNIGMKIDGYLDRPRRRTKTKVKAK